MKEAERVRLRDLSQVQEAAQLLRGRRNLHRQDRIAGLDGCQQMAHRTDAAHACGDTGHLIERTPLAELLETAKLGHVKPRIRHPASIIQIDADLGMSFDPCHRINDDTLSHNRSPQTGEWCGAV